MIDDLRDRVVTALKTIYDPEIPVNIYELGLVYDLRIAEPADVTVDMTLTAPNCPVAEILPNQVRQTVAAVEGVHSATVNLVFDPPWDRSKMSEAAKFAMGFDLDLGRDIVPLSKIRS